MEKPTRIQFRLKSLLSTIVVAAIAISLVQWLRTDTILHSEKPYILQLPNGRTIATNRWFRTNASCEFSFLATERKNEFYLIQNSDSSRIGVLQFDDEKYEAVVTDYLVRGPNYRGEYWLRAGTRIESRITKNELKQN